MTKADVAVVERDNVADSSRQAEADRGTFARQHRALLRLSADLAASLDEVEICQSIVHGLHDLQGYDYVGLFLVDESTGDRVLRASVGWADAPPDYRIPPGRGLSERPLLDGQVQYTPDVTQSPSYLPGIRGGTELDVPLQVADRLVGVLVVESAQIDAFDQDDWAVVTAAANQAAVALVRAREHQALQAAELRYQGLFDRVPMGLYRTTPAGRFLDANPAMVETLGYPDRDSLLAIDAADLYVDPRERQRWQVSLDREPVVRGFEAQFRRHDGSIIWARDTTRTICDSVGQVLYYEGSLEDITERKRAEALLHAQRDLALALGATTGLEATLQLCLDAAIGVSGMDSGAIYLMDATSSTLNIACARGLADEFMQTASHCDADSVNVRLVKKGEPAYGQHGELITRMDDARRREGLRALAVIPIHHEGRVIACLNVASHTCDEVPLFARNALETIAAQVSSAIARARTEEALARRTAQLEALRVVGLELAAKLNLEDLLYSIVSHAVELMGETSGGLYLYRPELDTLEWTVSVGSSQVPIGSRLQRGEGLSGKVWQTGEPLIVHDYQHWEGRAPLFEGFQWAAIVGAPVRWGDEFLGVVAVEGETPGAFQPADAELLSLFATQAAIAIKNARLFEAERATREQAETLQAATQALSATLDLQQVFALILSELRRVVPYDSASVQELKGDRLEIIGGHGFPNLEELLGETFDLRADDNPNREVTNSRVPFVLEDAPIVYAGFHREPHVRAGIRSWLGVPLLFGDRLIGMIALDKQEPGFYTEEHASLALAFAAQAAIAIENARLFETAQQHIGELEAVRQASLSLTSRLELSAVLEAILESTFKLLTEVTTAHVFLYRQDRLTFGAALWSDARKDRPLAEPRPDGLTYTVARQGQLVAVPDMRHHALYADSPPEWAGAIVGLPLKIEQRVVGVMNVAVQRPHAWPESELRLLRLLGDQAAIAIENARLFEAEREQRELIERLQETTLLVNSSLDLREVLELILDQLARVVPYDSGTVQILESGATRVIAVRNLPPDELGRRYPLDQYGYNRFVTRKKGPIVIHDVKENDQGWVPTVGLEHVQANIGVPLLVRGMAIGLLTIDSRQPGAYTEADAQIAQAFAQHAAIAIENARLFQAEREQRDLAEALRQATSAMSSTLDLEQILDTILEQVDRVIPNDAVNVNLIEGDLARMVRWRGYERLGQGIESVVLSVTHTPTLRRMKETGEVMVIPDLADYPNWIQVPEVAWIRSYAAAPIRVRDQVIGFLNVDSVTPGFFDQTHADRLGAFADQVSLAIENARLYEETRRQNRELALLNRVIAVSATGQMIETILEKVCRELALAFGVPHALAVLLNEERTEAAVVAEYQDEGDGHLGEILPAGDNPACQFLIQHKAPLVVDNAQTDPRLASIHAQMRQRGIVSLLMLPLIVEGEAIGRLELNAHDSRPFSSQEVNLAQRVADQVSGALARAQLAEAQRRLSIAVEQAAEAVVITDVQGSILYINPAFERITGHSRLQALGFGPHTPKGHQHRAVFYRDMWRIAIGNLPWHGRFTDNRPDGSQYTVDSTLTPVRNHAGEVVNYVATLRDVTREVQLEDQFHQAQKMEALGRLAGGLAHDFNNLLTVVHISAALMERQLRSEDPLWEHVHRIQDTGKRAANLTRQLLSFSRREVIEPRVLNLNDLVGNLSRVLQRVVGEDIELVTALSGNLWTVKVDPTQMDQVIMNLVVNARDAMPLGGSLTIETANTVLDEAYVATHVDVRPGKHVLLAITDTGVGMDSEVMGHLFEPFFTTKEPGQGTGLGLATVFGIVKQSGGHIRVFSELGQGTTFKVYLPCTEGDEPLHRISPGIFPRGSTKLASGTQTTLVTEDDADVLKLAVGVLQSCGYQVLAAGNGPEAVRISEQHDGPIHLLLTDVVMPQMNGQELAEHLQRQRPEMRVLYMSGYADKAVVQHGVLAHGAAFLPKPFTVEELTQKVWAVLKDRSQVPGVTP